MIKSEKVTGCPECGNNDLIRDYEAVRLGPLFRSKPPTIDVPTRPVDYRGEAFVVDCPCEGCPDSRPLLPLLEVECPPFWAVVEEFG